MKKVQMVDLIGQYQNIKTEVDQAILEVLTSARFIKGPQVNNFEKNLANYLNTNHVIGCANGTDALQIALMALGLQRGDEVIVPAFTYVATAEVIALLGLTPIMVDVDPDTFNTTAEIISNQITNRTKAIVPVHLFGQSAEMKAIMDLAQEHSLFVIEDNAQAIGSDYIYNNGPSKKAGTIGHIGSTSFFPSKNLGCYGDGGALCTNDDSLAERIRIVANHGQSKKYYHDMIGVNSRLDTIQAAILDVKLKYLDDYIKARQIVAAQYDKAFEGIRQVQTPMRSNFTTHVFHQYTLIIKDGSRDDLKQFLADRGIPSMIYYPLPLYRQNAFRHYYHGESMPHTERLCQSVLSLPIHTEMDLDSIKQISNTVVEFYD